MRVCVCLCVCSWGSGADLWGSDSDARFDKPRIDDGMLEVVGVTGVVHMVSPPSLASMIIWLAFYSFPVAWPEESIVCISDFAPNQEKHLYVGLCLTNHCVLYYLDKRILDKIPDF